MVEENISQKFRLKNIDEIRHYLLEEIMQNELMSKKHKKVCTTLNYVEHVILASAITGCTYLINIVIHIKCTLKWKPDDVKLNIY